MNKVRLTLVLTAAQLEALMASRGAYEEMLGWAECKGPNDEVVLSAIAEVQRAAVNCEAAD